jgi:hypothetical protein
MAQELDGVADAYRAPVEDEGEVEHAGEREGPAFFVVSIPKLLVLEILTMRFYSVYWFYKHWSTYRKQTGQGLNALFRAIFSIFYVHRLFRAIDSSARASGFSPSWTANSQATLFVALSIVSWVLGRGSSGLAGSVVSMALGISTVLPTIAAQKVANLASGDPEGRRNSQFDAGSILAAVFGLALWAAMIWAVVEARRVLALPLEPQPGF